MKIITELLRIDEVDEQGDIITRECAEKMIAAFHTVPVTHEFQQDSRIGKALGLFLDGNRLMVELDLTDDGANIYNNGLEAALGGVCDTPDRTTRPVTLENVRLTDVALTKKKIKYGGD